MITRTMIVGKPSSGKSTLIDIITKLYEKKGINCCKIDDYIALKELCPNIPNAKKYYYRDDCLILRDEFRKDVMASLYLELKRRWNLNFNGVIVMEVANPDLKRVIDDYFLLDDKKSISSALVLVSTLKNIAKSRNDLREAWRRIPDIFINMFVEDDLTTLRNVEMKFGYFRKIKNNSSLEDFKNTAEKLFSELYSYSKDTTE